MQRILLTAVIVSLVGCRSPRTPNQQVIDGRGLVGVAWITPPQPWHTATPALSFVVLDDVVVVSGWRGWIGTIDLMTGAVVRERWLDGEIWELARLRDGRLLALGQLGKTNIAMTLDAKTLVATPITLPGAHEKWEHADATVLDDGGVVITGRELPLAIYDPATWSVRRVIDARLGWDATIALGTTLLAQRNTADDDRVARFDLATGAHMTLGPARHLAAGGNVIARSVIDNGIDSARVDVEVDGQLRHSIPGIDMGIAIDASGSRLLVHSEYDEVTVYALPSVEKLQTVPLGQAGTVVRLMELTETRAVMIAESTVRVLDLITDTITPQGTPPFGRPSSLAVSNDGDVAFIGSHAWRIVKGEVDASFPVGTESRLSPAPGEVHRFAIADGAAVTVTSFDDGRPVRRWALHQSSYPGWFAGDDVALGVISPRQRSRLLRSRGSELRPVIDFDVEAQLSDVDLRSERALISWNGTAHVVSLRDGTRSAAVPIPGCGHQRAILEPGGRLLATSDNRTVTIWEGAAARATTRFDDDELVRVAFVPGTEDVVVLLERHLALWSPRTGELRSIGVASIFEIAVSPDGRRLALAFGDDRVAVIDVEAFRAAVTVERALVGATPPACPASDPFSAPRIP